MILGKKVYVLKRENGCSYHSLRFYHFIIRRYLIFKVEVKGLFVFTRTHVYSSIENEAFSLSLAFGLILSSFYLNKKPDEEEMGILNQEEDFSLPQSYFTEDEQ